MLCFSCTLRLLACSLPIPPGSLNYLGDFWIVRLSERLGGYIHAFIDVEHVLLFRRDLLLGPSSFLIAAAGITAGRVFFRLQIWSISVVAGQIIPDYLHLVLQSVRVLGSMSFDPAVLLVREETRLPQLPRVESGVHTRHRRDGARNSRATRSTLALRSRARRRSRFLFSSCFLSDCSETRLRGDELRLLLFRLRHDLTVFHVSRGSSFFGLRRSKSGIARRFQVSQLRPRGLEGIPTRWFQDWPKKPASLGNDSSSGQNHVFQPVVFG